MTESTPTTPTTEHLTQEQGSTQQSIGQIVDRMACLLQGEEPAERKQFEALHTAFYRRKKQAEQEGSISAEELLLQEARLNDLYQQLRTIERKRSEALAAQQIENGKQAEVLLDELERLLTGEGEFATIYKRYHEIRSEWEGLRPLTQQDESRLGKRFVQLRSAFYELNGFEDSLRNDDYRKHLEQKQSLLQELELLSGVEDIVSALDKLSNQLVARWRDVGPVAPELRADIEGKYKELTTAIFKRHQAYQEGLKAGEEQNAQLKKDLISKVQAYVSSVPQHLSDWLTATETIKALQEEWRQIGSAGRKLNNELYTQFRAVCNDFFEARNQYNKQRKEEQAQGVSQRKNLIERAVEIAKGNNYGATAKALSALQEEWKRLPHLRKSEADALWAEFRKPFQDFYERKRQYDEKQQVQERANEEGKRSILARLKALAEDQELPQGLRDTLATLKDEWRSLGRAGAKVNDALWAEFCGLNDTLYERLRGLQGQRRSEQIKAKQEKLSGDKQGLQQELQFLQRKADRLRAELRNYENNINFLSSTSKTENPLLKEVERKQQRLAQDLARLEEEIKVLKSQPKDE